MEEEGQKKQKQSNPRRTLRGTKKTNKKNISCFLVSLRGLVIEKDENEIELKALTNLSGKEEAQLINYLKATGFKVGLLINFGSPNKLEWKRFVH